MSLLLIYNIRMQCSLLSINRLRVQLEYRVFSIYNNNSGVFVVRSKAVVNRSDRVERYEFYSSSEKKTFVVF